MADLPLDWDSDNLTPKIQATVATSYGMFPTEIADGQTITIPDNTGVIVAWPLKMGYGSCLKLGYNSCLANG